MAITQERMKRVLDSMDELAKQYFLFARLTAGLVHQVNKGELPAEAALEQIESLVINPEATIAAPLILLREEQAHYKYSHNKNEQERRRLAKKRDGQPVRKYKERKPAPYQDQARQHNTDNATARLARANAAMDEGSNELVFDPSKTVSQEELDSLEAFGKQQEKVLAGLNINKGDHK